MEDQQNIKDIIIVGSGLSGMSAGYFLKKQYKNVQIIQASQNLGGRIKTTVTQTGGILEMGATWVFNNHQLKKLLKQLNIDIYQQFSKGYALYQQNLNSKPQRIHATQIVGTQPIYKIVGGTYKIINALAQKIGNQNIIKNTFILNIQDKGQFIKLISSQGQIFNARKIILAIPPKLLEASIKFQPKLSQIATQIRKKTHTWMGESVKCCIEYKRAFWRLNNLAGVGMSQVGLLREVQDQVNAYNTAFALVGFLNLTKEQMAWSIQKRREHVINDLVRLFGVQAKDYLNYEDYIWSENNLITVKDIINTGLYVHQNNGNEQIIRPQMNNKLFFAGAETSYQNSGYMEGAVKSGKKAAQLIISKHNDQ